MPLYTLVISHRGRIAVAQQRRSNWRGFYQAVIEKFPDLAPAHHRGGRRDAGLAKIVAADWSAPY